MSKLFSLYRAPRDGSEVKGAIVLLAEELNAEYPMFNKSRLDALYVGEADSAVLDDEDYLGEHYARISVVRIK